VASQVDYAIVFVSTNSGEGHDRESLSLNLIPYAGPNGTSDALVSAVAAANKKTIVVMVSPGPVLTPWRDEVAAIVAAFLPGQEYGTAMADVLWGDYAPTARLPMTMPASETDLGFTQEQYPGVEVPHTIPRPTPTGTVMRSTYTEKLEVGYRYYDAHNVEPAFPFGHGLTYTTFEYGQPKVSEDRSSVKFSVKNTGERDGTEVVQLYISFPSAAGEPPKQLKGFQQVYVVKGDSQQVQLPLNDRSFSIWDVPSHSWKVQKGEYTLMVGASSRDIRSKTSLTL